MASPPASSLARRSHFGKQPVVESCFPTQNRWKIRAVTSYRTDWPVSSPRAEMASSTSVKMRVQRPTKGSVSRRRRPQTAAQRSGCRLERSEYLSPNRLSTLKGIKNAGSLLIQGASGKLKVDTHKAGECLLFYISLKRLSRKRKE